MEEDARKPDGAAPEDTHGQAGYFNAVGRLLGNEVGSGVGGSDGEQAEADKGDEAQHRTKREWAEQDVEGLFRAALHGFPKGQEALELFIAGIAPPYGEPQQSHEQGHKYRATDKFTHGAPTRDTGDEAACERNIRNIP